MRQATVDFNQYVKSVDNMKLNSRAFNSVSVLLFTFTLSGKCLVLVAKFVIFLQFDYISAL